MSLPCRRTLVRATPDLAHFFLIIFLILVTVALAATAALGELINFFATLSGALCQSSASGSDSTREVSWQSGAFSRPALSSTGCCERLHVCTLRSPHFEAALHCAASSRDGLSRLHPAPGPAIRACCRLPTLAVCLLHPQ